MVKVRIAIFRQLGIIMKTFLIITIKKIQIRINSNQFEEVSTTEIMRITVMIHSISKRKSIDTINSELGMPQNEMLTSTFGYFGSLFMTDKYDI